MQDFGSKTDNSPPPGGQLSAAEFNNLATENENAVLRSGAALSGASETQLAESLFIHAVKAQSFQDSGAANAYVCTPISGSSGVMLPAAYTNLSGSMLRFIAANSNSGASTINIGQTTGTLLGSKKILSVSGAALVGGEIVSGAYVSLTYDPALDGGAGAWRVLSSNATTTQAGIVELSTDAEAIAGASTSTAVPPSALLAEQKAHPTFSAHRNNVNQTAIASGVATKIILTTEDFDNQAAFDTTLSRYTPLMAGIYQVNFASRLNTATDQSSFTVFIYKNGTQFKSSTLIQSGAAGTQSAIVSHLITMNGTTDYLEFFITQDTGSARDVLGATLQTFASAALVVRT